MCRQQPARTTRGRKDGSAAAVDAFICLTRHFWSFSDDAFPRWPERWDGALASLGFNDFGPLKTRVLVVAENNKPISAKDLHCYAANFSADWEMRPHLRFPTSGRYMPPICIGCNARQRGAAKLAGSVLMWSLERKREEKTWLRLLCKTLSPQHWELKRIWLKYIRLTIFSWQQWSGQFVSFPHL